MSSAIAEATSALCTLLSEALARSSGLACAAAVTHLRSADVAMMSGAATVNVALLGAEPDPAHRNRSVGGELPLLLTYLISVHGDETELIPQQLLGAVAAALDRTPAVTIGSAAAPETVPIRLLPRDAGAWHEAASGSLPLALTYSVGPVNLRHSD